MTFQVPLQQFTSHHRVRHHTLGVRQKCVILKRKSTNDHEQSIFHYILYEYSRCTSRIGCAFNTLGFYCYNHIFESGILQNILPFTQCWSLLFVVISNIFSIFTCSSTVCLFGYFGRCNIMECATVSVEVRSLPRLTFSGFQPVGAMNLNI